MSVQPGTMQIINGLIEKGRCRLSLFQKEEAAMGERRDSFLQTPGAVWLKGNLHCHSQFSDGKLSLEELKYIYQHHGYDFLAVTDHDRYTDCRKLSDESLLMLNGTEITGYTPNEKRIHLNVFWKGSFAGIEPGKSFCLKNGVQTAALLKQLKEQGCYVMLNHPHWSMLQSCDVERLRDIDAVEIYNYSTEWIENMGEGSLFWEQLLREGRRLWGGGSDDNHNRSEVDSLYCDSFGGFTVVKAESRTEKGIFEALQAGSFYTSTGPQIYEFYVEEQAVYVRCSPCCRIIINGNERQYQRRLGKYITEFSAVLEGSETFIRAECMDAAGRTAYTNPIFLDK